MKDLLITHVDLDGISPIILLNLAGRKFDYKTIEIREVTETFDELFKTDLSIHENIYITDLTLTEEIYKYINDNNIKVKVFDHHETHLFANKYDYVNVKIDDNGIQTCGTEIFYNYLKDIYPELNTPIIAHYVDLVRQIDTYKFESELPHHLDFLKETYGKTDYIKTMTRRLKKDKPLVTLTSFEKRFVKLKEEEKERYMQKRESTMKVYKIEGHTCGVVFAERNKSDLGNYLSNNHPELDLIILIDASSRISYRTAREDVSVSDFAAIFGGGGHQKASGSKFDDDDRDKIIKDYFNYTERLDVK